MLGFGYWKTSLENLKSSLFREMRGIVNCSAFPCMHIGFWFTCIWNLRSQSVAEYSNDSRSYGFVSCFNIRFYVRIRELKDIRDTVEYFRKSSDLGCKNENAMWVKLIAIWFILRLILLYRTSRNSKSKGPAGHDSPLIEQYNSHIKNP